MVFNKRTLLVKNFVYITFDENIHFVPSNTNLEKDNIDTQLKINRMPNSEQAAKDVTQEGLEKDFRKTLINIKTYLRNIGFLGTILKT